MPESKHVEVSGDIDFTKTPYARIEFLDSLESSVGKTFPTPEEIQLEFLHPGEKDISRFLKDLCVQNNVHHENAKTLSQLLDKLFGHFVEPHLKNPTFVLYHPVCMSPLAKEHRKRPGNVFTLNQNQKTDLNISNQDCLSVLNFLPMD